MNLLIKQVDDATSIINKSLKTLNGLSSKKINFRNSKIDDNFYSSENLYAVVFDVDKSCMLDKNDPMNALSLLGDKVLGIYSCMRDDDSVSVISGTEDESGLILKTYLVAYICATYEEIKDSLSYFIDELKFLPLDIETLLGISIGEIGNQIDSLKELADITKNLNIDLIYEEVDIAIESVKVDTLQYSQLQRFLDIAGLIDESDASKLTDFFSNIYKGEVYIAKKQEVIIDDALRSTLNGMLSQQNHALQKVQTDNDMQTIVSMMESLRKYFPNMPKDISSKKLVSEFINTQLNKRE